MVRCILPMFPFFSDCFLNVRFNLEHFQKENMSRRRRIVEIVQKDIGTCNLICLMQKVFLLDYL